MQDIENMLGNVSRRFDDWMEEDLYASRLTVMRSDGVPQTFESRANSHFEARRLACMLAVSANALDRGEWAMNGSGVPINMADGTVGNMYNDDYAEYPADIPGSPTLSSGVPSEGFSPTLEPVHGPMHGAGQGPMQEPMRSSFPSFMGTVPGFMEAVPGSMGGMVPFYVARSMGHGAVPGFNGVANSPMTMLGPAHDSSYMGMGMYGMHNMQSGHGFPPHGGYPGIPATGEGLPQPPFEAGTFQQMPQHQDFLSIVGQSASRLNSARLDPMTGISKHRGNSHVHPFLDKKRRSHVAQKQRKSRHSEPGAGRSQVLLQEDDDGTNAGSVAEREAKGSWYDVVDKISVQASKSGMKSKTHPSGGSKSRDTPWKSRSAGDDRSVLPSPKATRRNSGQNDGKEPTSAIRPRTLFRVDAHQEDEEFNFARVEDNEDEDDNRITKFNELCQKGVAGLRVPRYQYEYKSDIPGAAPCWQCRATTSAKNPDMREPRRLCVVAQGKNKKDARRMAAKQLLLDLLRFGIVTQDVLDSKPFPTPETPDELETSGPGLINGVSSPDVAGAVSVLNQLWQKELLACKPKWSVVPASTGAIFGWKCDLLIKTKRFGDIQSSFTSTQKKTCRQMAAFEAVQRLKEIKYPGLDAVNINARQQSNVSSEAPQLDSDDEESSCFEDEADDRIVEDLNASKNDVANVVQHRAPAEEKRAGSPFAGGEAGFGSLFSLSSDIKIVIATDTTSCDDWVASNVQSDCALGLYVDSGEVRRTLRPHIASAGVDLDPALGQDSECRVICLASQDSALVVCSHYFRDSRVTTIDEITDQKIEIAAPDTDDLDFKPVHAKANDKTRPPHAKGSWIPSVIRSILERRDCIKCGIALDEGALILGIRHGIVCRGITDLGISSFALKGMVPRSLRLLAGPIELVGEWLSSRLDPFSSRAFGNATELCEVPQSIVDNIVPAGLIAVASKAIQRRILESAESRRRKRYENMEEFAELCDRLCSDAKAPPSPSRKVRKTREGVTEQNDNDCKLIPMPVA